MPRHRGVFNLANPEPYELSRTRVENFVKCPCCFYLVQVKGIQFPTIPGFNINEATDILLKRDFDKYRGTKNTHPYLVKMGLDHLHPYQHKHFEFWTQSMHFGAKDRMHTVHNETNLKIGGGLDDVWINTKTNQLHIIDYKSTSQKSDKGPITLDEYYKESYKRQMDLYVWIMKRKGFEVNDVGYFLYCDGDRFTKTQFLRENKAIMEFKLTLIPYQTDHKWIEPTLRAIKGVLSGTTSPNHSSNCEYGNFLKALTEV